MILPLKTEKIEDLITSTTLQECECIHCEKLRQQQLESETRWLRIQQAFDK
tara:strand:- start:404 stop:556 length:153 start_codon:yes stop_codon:yes gene_type:complete